MPKQLFYYIITTLKELIKTCIDNAVRKIVPDFRGDFSVEVPENSEHGDYSTNVALLLAKSLQKNSAEAAEELTRVLIGQLDGWKIKTAGPGFINFWISEKFLQKEFRKILQEGESYGRGKNKKTKLQVEYVSANPTGPLTLANGRGGFLGDALSNILEFSGYSIEREYYVNDTGNQIITLGKSILAAAGVIPKEGYFYQGGYIKKWADGNKPKVKRFKGDPLKLGQEAVKYFLADIKKNLKAGRISFDRFTSENSDIHKKSLVKKSLGELEKSGKVYKNEGAVWLKTTDFGDDKDRVLITSDGFPTYFLADAGHYLETKKRKFDGKINILGPDHFGYVKRIQIAADLLDFKNSKIIVTQAVRLLKDGAEVKMSKRVGEFITVADLLKEVGGDVARYFFLEKSPDTHIDFNLDLAKERSLRNPIYYIQYAYVRCSGILKKVSFRRPELKNVELLSTIEERNLLKKLIQFPELVEDISRDFQVNRLACYMLELARIFHNFYEKHRVITKDQKLTMVRITLVQATKIVFKTSLGLFGVAVPKKM